MLYNGFNGLVYSTVNLSGIIPNQDEGYGTLAFAYPADGIQNGSPDGIALVDPSSNVIQFLSYEGTFVAVDGAAIGLSSINIGVSESGAEAVGQSLQLSGTGNYYEDFTWTGSSPASAGTVNAGLNFTPSIQYAVLQFPASTFAEAGLATATIYGRVYQSGFTESAGASANVVAQLGYGPLGSDPTASSEWTWVNASFNAQYGNDDEYQATLAIPRIGQYSYTFRFAVIESGTQSNWTYADLDGAGSDPGLSLSTSQLGGVLITYHYVDGDTGNEVLNGGSADDLVSGYDGNDTLNGLAGNDYLTGGPGDDVMAGGAGNDLLEGGTGTDTASYQFAAAAVTVDLAKTTIQNTIGAGRDTLMSSIENLRGSNFADFLYGDDNNNVLDGRGDADEMRGRGGNDLYYVDNAGDLVGEALNAGLDTVRASIDYTLLANVENLVLTGSANLEGSGNTLANQVTGNSGDNLLDGKAGDDVIRGLAGADTIFGGIGKDVMYAGVDAQTDTLVFRHAGESGLGAGRDVIWEFDSDEDVIDLQLIDANTQTGGNQTFAFSQTGPAANSVWIVDIGAHLIVRADVNGDTVQDFEIQVQNTSQVLATDFLL